ncbi:MAG: hypothetical protein DHS20C21_13200 [Gemmatimonadota bacterium]|nr:MAG: hypothetical protein DHS20C21_13200 [Gemmatimonadota bacterium]
MFARRVRAGFESQYDEWLKGISRTASGFPGSQGTTVLRPGEGREEYIAISQFASAEDLERWLCSTERRQWLEKLESITLDHEEVTSLTGMERWFTLPNRAVTQPPPRYKTAVLVLAGLYPLVLLLDLILSPFLTALPGPLQVFVSLVVSIAIMVWGVLPQLTRLFFRWLYPGHEPRLTRPRDP